MHQFLSAHSIESIYIQTLYSQINYSYYITCKYTQNYSKSTLGHTCTLGKLICAHRSDPHTKLHTEISAVFLDNMCTLI